MSDSKQKFHMNMGPILNGYGVMGIFLIPVHALVWTALKEQRLRNSCLLARDLALQAFPPDRRETTISPKFRVDCGKEIRVVIHISASVLW